GLPRQRQTNGDKKKGIYRNQNDGKTIPTFIPEPVLQRRKNKKRPEKRAMICAGGADEAYIFAQRQQRDKRKQQHGTGWANHERNSEYPNHDPPGANTGVEIVDGDSFVF